MLAGLVGSGPGCAQSALLEGFCEAWDVPEPPRRPGWGGRRPWGCPSPCHAGAIRASCGQGGVPNLEPPSTPHSSQLVVLKQDPGFPVQPRHGTSLAAGMGKERTGRSPQALLSRLHRRARHFKNPILGFVVAFLQGPSLCREAMMRVSHFSFHGINVQNKWSKLHCAGRREQGRACK